MSDAFAAIADLDDETLRALLAGADPQARLHAAWALGLRSSVGGTAAARALLTREPHAGVRRHLAVMLGGDLDALSALLDLDPSERVRSTALRLLVQSWPRDRRPALGERVIRVLARETDEDVLLVAIELASDLDDVITVDRAAPFLASAQARVRAGAIDALLKHRDPRGARCVADASFSWPDEVRQRTWQRFLPSHRDALVSSARARDLDAERWVELIRMAFDDGEMEHADIAWLSDHGRALDEEVLRISRAASLPQALLIAHASELSGNREELEWRAWRCLYLLAAQGHDGLRIEPALAAPLAEISGALERRWQADAEHLVLDLELDVAWLREGLVRLAAVTG